MAYQATGRLHKVFDTEQKSASFAARDFVVEVADGKFPQMIKFQLVQDKCTLIDDYSEGDEISVEFDLRGREWNDKYFTNLNAWRIGKADGQSGGSANDSTGSDAPSASYTSSTSGTSSAPLQSNDDFDDDIPF